MKWFRAKEIETNSVDCPSSRVDKAFLQFQNDELEYEVNALKNMVFLLETEIQILKDKQKHKKNKPFKIKKKRIKLIDVILDVFKENDEELRIEDILREMEWKKLGKKPSKESVWATLYYLERAYGLRRGKQRGTFCRAA